MRMRIRIGHQLGTVDPENEEVSKRFSFHFHILMDSLKFLYSLEDVNDLPRGAAQSWDFQLGFYSCPYPSSQSLNESDA